MALKREEILRKLLHLVALLMPAGIFYLPHPGLSALVGLSKPVPSYVPIAILAVIFVTALTVEIVRFRSRRVQKVFYGTFGHMLRRDETNAITGSTYLVGAALICSILFIDRPYISCMALSLFILGDAVAAITGLSIGKIKIGKKSLEGSAACFILCMAFFYAVFPYSPWLLDAWETQSAASYLIIAVAASLSTTLFELFPLKISKNLVINDNLAVPVITSGIMLALEKFLM